MRSRSVPSTWPTSSRCCERIGDARVVLIGEATHGTSEFYRMREQDHARADRRRRDSPSSPSKATGRTPRASTITCATSSFRRRSGPRLPASRPGCGATTRCASSSTGCASTTRDKEPRERAAFHGLDLYSLHNSIRAVLDYLDDVDPAGGAGRARTLWLPHAVAIRSRHLWARRADRAAIGPARTKSR